MSLVVGLGGGIGSGKSEVADRLVARGAALIDADVVAREVVDVGKPAYNELIAHFGEGILAADRSIDRAKLASVTFGSNEALASLNAITHPAIGKVMFERCRTFGATESIVVIAIPLLRPEHRVTLSLNVVVIVDVDPDIAFDRLVSRREMDPIDARARIASQMAREERVAMADYVVTNSGDLASLDQSVDQLWGWLEAKRNGSGGLADRP